MPIYFNNSSIKEPFTFDTIGNNWLQELIFRPKGCPVYHYLQTEKGLGKIEIQGKQYFLEEGEGVLIAPFIPHSYSGESKEWITSFVTITGRMESSISNILRNKRFIFTTKEQTEYITTTISNSIRYFEQNPIDTKAVSVCCYQLLLYFMDGMSTQDLLQEPLYQKYVAPVIKEMETHYEAKLTVQELSNKVFITPQYLSRLFGRFMGCSVYEYLTSYRLNKAKELLLTAPHLDVQTITRLVGFDDTSHFIAMFKKATGTTPLEFRKLYRFKFC